jgi:hypothetical protein
MGGPLMARGAEVIWQLFENPELLGRKLGTPYAEPHLFDPINR